MSVRALFDVNVLVAMIDPQHVHHGRAHAWWAVNRPHGWASCPLTQNGCIRVIAQPAYSHPVSLAFARAFLADQMAATDHAFWPDDISLLDSERFTWEQVIGPKQLTDVYLLGLAVKNGGRLVTFDTTVSLEAVSGADARHLAVV